MKTVLKSIGLMVAAMLVLQAHALNTQDAANRMGATEYKEIIFPREATNLTDAQKDEIRSMITSARGVIDQVKILTWADTTFNPTNNNQTKYDINLAKDRLNYLRSFVRSDLKVTNVETYNMADHPESVDKILASTPATATTELYDGQAQASKGAIILFMKK